MIVEFYGWHIDLAKVSAVSPIKANYSFNIHESVAITLEFASQQDAEKARLEFITLWQRPNRMVK